MNLPNALTIARIFFVPLLVAALVEQSFSVRIFGTVVTHEWLALAIFLSPPPPICWMATSRGAGGR